MGAFGTLVKVMQQPQTHSSISSVVVGVTAGGGGVGVGVVAPSVAISTDTISSSSTTTTTSSTPSSSTLNSSGEYLFLTLSPAVPSSPHSLHSDCSADLSELSPRSPSPFLTKDTNNPSTSTLSYSINNYSTLSRKRARSIEDTAIPAKSSPTATSSCSTSATSIEDPNDSSPCPCAACVHYAALEKDSSSDSQNTSPQPAKRHCPLPPPLPPPPPITQRPTIIPIRSRTQTNRTTNSNSNSNSNPASTTVAPAGGTTSPATPTPTISTTLTPLSGSTEPTNSISIPNQSQVSSTSTPLSTADLSVIELFECPICRSLLCQPITTGCGHTFCRSCLMRCTSVACVCPMCRRAITVDANAPETVLLTQAIMRLWPAEYKERLAELGPITGHVQFTIPILSIPVILFPGMVLPLHLFEPRDRVVLQRALQGSGTFGVLSSQATDNDIGTIAIISSHVSLPDGRCLVSTRGDSRFRVINQSVDEFDGCTLATVERVPEQSVETLSRADEAAEVEFMVTFARTHIGSLSNLATTIIELMESAPPIDRLFTYLKDRIRTKSGSSLSLVEQKFGPLPDSNATLFSYWVASLLPITLKQKQELLGQLSTRVRLAMEVVFCK